MDTKESNMPVAGRLKEVIEEKSLKQAAVAKKAGYKAQELNDMLKGRRLIKACDVPNIAKVLHVKVDEIYEKTPMNFTESNELFKRE